MFDVAAAIVADDVVKCAIDMFKLVLLCAIVSDDVVMMCVMGLY